MAPPFADPPPFDNSGHGPIAVPGFGYPLEQELHPEDRFTHGVHEWFQEPNLTARELAMLSLIDNITDKTTWSTDVFDDKKTSQLAQEALLSHLISPKTWEWCLSELQDKARIFQSTGRILVYNTGVVISKSDLVVDRESRTDIRDELSTLTSSSPFETAVNDLFFEPARQIHRVVDPLMYPLIYGKSRVLAEGGTVPLNDMFKHINKCDIAPSIPITGNYLLHRTCYSICSEWEAERQRGSSWSTNFQRLPCEIEFLEGVGTDVRIASYINGLHPRNHGLYHAIEKIISSSVESWNDVLIKQGRGRFPTRIKTYGVSYEPPRPDFDRFREAGKHPGSEDYYAAIEEAKAYCAQPDDFPYDSSDDEETRPWLFKENVPEDWDAWCRSDNDLAKPMWIKYNRLTHFVHPEPGTAYTYQQWKSGQAWEPIKPKVSNGHEPVMEGGTAQIPHQAYTIALQDSFRQKGLQVIVKVDRIELNPDDPSFPGSDWHVEGLHNEHIVANSIYVLDEDNTSSPRIAFRQETYMDEDEFDYKYNLKQFLQVFAVPYKEQILGGSLSPPPLLQRLGSVNLASNRLLAWPSVLHHRITPFELVDKTKPGHRSFLTLSLVDPYYRVCSTRNVPPQNHDWWADEALSAALPTNVHVPRELIDHIDSFTDSWPMGLEEATKVRENMAKEQKDHERYIMNKTPGDYDFNLDEYNDGNFPHLPRMEIGSS
ncbi:hypothetical protein KCU98_g9291, partial [Aureobasidium melanogenum]